MKLTVLELTQNILSALSSDEVNSISDTTESMQVATILQTTYFNLLTRYNLPEHDQLFKLISSTDATKPVVMTIPNGINRMEWVKYYVEPSANSNPSSFIHDLNLDIHGQGGAPMLPPPAFTDIKMLTIKEFIDMTNRLNNLDNFVGTCTLDVTNVSTQAVETFQFRFRNDKPPQYCCTIQNDYVVFDSYDNLVDSCLQSTNTMCYGWVLPYFLLEDNFVPLLDDQQFPLLLNEAKSLAFFELKQMPHAKAEQEVKRQISTIQKYKSEVNKPTPFEEFPNYGRRGRGWM